MEVKCGVLVPGILHTLKRQRSGPGMEMSGSGLYMWLFWMFFFEGSPFKSNHKVFNDSLTQGTLVGCQHENHIMNKQPKLQPKVSFAQIIRNVGRLLIYLGQVLPSDPFGCFK